MVLMIMTSRYIDSNSGEYIDVGSIYITKAMMDKGLKYIRTNIQELLDAGMVRKHLTTTVG